MTTTTLRPQIITSVNSSTSFVNPAGYKTAAMIGTAQWGPLDTATTISTISEYLRTFGSDTASGLTGIRGADLFFRNGGVLNFVRIEGASAEASAASVLILDDGAADDLIDLEAKYNGTYGDNISAQVTATGSNRNLIITDGVSIENYNNAGLGYDSTTDLIAAVNAKSNLVTATLNIAGTGLPVVLSKTQLASGDDGATVVIGDYTTALSDVLYSEDFQYLLVPSITTDSELLTLTDALVLREANERKFAVLISGVAVDETILDMAARTSSSGSKRCRLVAPNAVYTERVASAETTLDGSYLACAVAGMLCSLNYSSSATHKTVSVDDLSILVSTGKKYYNKVEQEQVLQSGIIPVTLIGRNIQVVRDVTRIGDTTSVYFSGSVSDIVDYATAQLEDYLNTIIGMPSTTTNMKVWGSQCDSILEQMFKSNIITEFETTAITEGSSANSLDVVVSIQPAYSVDFIYLTITIWGDERKWQKII